MFYYKGTKKQDNLPILFLRYHLPEVFFLNIDTHLSWMFRYSFKWCLEINLLLLAPKSFAITRLFENPAVTLPISSCITPVTMRIGSFSIKVLSFIGQYNCNLPRNFQLIKLLEKNDRHTSENWTSSCQFLQQYVTAKKENTLLPNVKAVKTLENLQTLPRKTTNNHQWYASWGGKTLQKLAPKAFNFYYQQHMLSGCTGWGLHKANFIVLFCKSDASSHKPSSSNEWFKWDGLHGSRASTSKCAAFYSL